MSKERETEEEEAKRGRVIAVAALLLLITLSLSVLLVSGTEPEIEMGGVDAWVSDGIDVEVNETRGRVEDVTIGDPATPLRLAWTGFGSNETEVEFEVLVSGARRNDGRNWSNGRATTSTEVLARGSYTVEGRNGEIRLSWGEVFGKERPVSVGEHTEIDASDFGMAGGRTVRRSLDVAVIATAPDERVSDEGGSPLTALVGEDSSEPRSVSNEVTTRVALVVVDTGSGADGDSGGTTGAGSTDTGEETPEAPETDPTEDLPPGAGGGTTEPPASPEVGEDTGVIGSGSFEVSSEHKVEENG